jgi:Putative DNA-binding domain
MAESDLSELVSGKTEALDVEYKAWMDTTEPATRAKLAKHIAALANHGGGYLIFGVEDKSREPMGETMLDRSLFSQDTLSGIVKKYLDPRLQIRVEEAEHMGVRYPVVIVPSHGARPVVAVADGPRVDGKSVGVRQGGVYVRSAGPESIAIRNPDDWNALLDRCLAHRADLTANIMRHALAKPGRPSLASVQRLTSICTATADDFAAQARTLAINVPLGDIDRVNLAVTAHCALGYALVDANGESIELENLRALAGRAAVGMRQYAYSRDGWALFLPLTASERSPQLRTEGNLAEERTYLEGMRLPNTMVLGGTLDYWRIYDLGFAVTAQSYREDYIGEKLGVPPYLTVAQTLLRLHSLLAHARIVGEETPGVEQVILRLDWRGLAGRPLLWAPSEDAVARAMAGDRLVKNIVVPWFDLRDRYFDSLRRVALPFFDAFPNEGWTPPGQWLTREIAERELARVGSDGRARLFEG